MDTHEKHQLAGAAGALVGVALIVALVVAMKPKPAPTSPPTTPPQGGGDGSGVVPKGGPGDPWADLKTQISLLQVAASSLRQDVFVNHPSVWAVYIDAVGNLGVVSSAQNLMVAPDGTPLNPPASQDGLSQLNTATSRLYQDASAASTATLVPATTKALVASVAAATLNVSRAAFTAGVGVA